VRRLVGVSCNDRIDLLWPANESDNDCAR
jgi:hypothetical protein